MTKSTSKGWEKEFGEALKSLGLGMSGSQADFIFEWVRHILHSNREEVIRDCFRAIKPIFEDWASNSQYVTGAWITSDYVEPDKKGKHWDFMRRNAWEQFSKMLDDKLAGRELQGEQK